MRAILSFSISAFSFLFIMLSANVVSSQKKMDHTTFDLWKRISEKKISNNGDWVAYVSKPGKGDNTLYLYNTRDMKTFTFERASDFTFDQENAIIAFIIKPPLDTIENLKRQKTKKKDMPSDTLGIFNLKTKKLEKIKNIQGYKMPSKKGGLIAIKYKAEKQEKDDKESMPKIVSAEIEKEGEEVTKEGMVEKEGEEIEIIELDSMEVKKRKENDDNGTRLEVRDLARNSKIILDYVTDYTLADKSKTVLYLQTGSDTLEQNALKVVHMDPNEVLDICEFKGEYKHLSIHEDGDHVSFMVNRDTTDAQIPPFELFKWSTGNTLHIVCDGSESFVPEDWILNEHRKPVWSEFGTEMVFGISPKPMLQDTNILDNEIVNVEVWSHTDQVLYTQQEVGADREKKKAYDCIYASAGNKITCLESEEVPNVRFDKKLKHKTLIGTNDENYQKYVSWEGHDYNDVYFIDKATGKKEKVLERLYGFPIASPEGKYGFWYSRGDSVWYTLDIQTKKQRAITNVNEVKCFDENNDRPMDAWNYGWASWLNDDKGLIVYDKYDLWLLDPTNTKKPKRLTNGRESKTFYRYVELDNELETLPSDTTILINFQKESDKSEGLAMLNLSTGNVELITSGPYTYSRNILKAKNSDDIVFTRSNFREFPDLRISTLDNFSENLKISNINPQQKDYAWGSASQMQWESPTGDTLTGMLFVPDGFDKKKKYPLLVNFYERSSRGLNRHRAPYPHRSTINYSYYINKGYVIFNPDILYRVGEPGESCVDAVLSGVEALTKQGFIDEERMGVQGHSWGGYQIAHLLTRTNIFRCAESGAPVVNMVSAYGGIRWGSGMSRMFQYEHTQSRLGATLWENPEVYLKNSPIFNIDKIETPVLILHNDKDGAVPWYQGIEFFVAMRRLDKKAWMLNYNDEPHWPLKRQNRVDFNRRMEQFFDHYLMDAPMPEWMKKGVPAIEKGINKGY